MCETCKNGIYPTTWSDVEGKSGVDFLVCPDCGKKFWGEFFPITEAAQKEKDKMKQYIEMKKRYPITVIFEEFIKNTLSQKWDGNYSTVVNYSRLCRDKIIGGFSP